VASGWDRRRPAGRHGWLAVLQRKALLANQAKVVEVPELVALAKDGDRRAFDRLVELHAPAIYNLALRVTRCREDAEDCVQEAFLRAYTGLRSFRGEAAFSTWLYRVALNVAREQAKRAGRLPVCASELLGDDPERAGPELEEIGWRHSSQPDPEQAAVADQRRRVLLRALRTLPDHQREVIVLYDLQGLSYEEIAQVLRIRVGTVKSRLNRARLALKDTLRPHLDLLREGS
jgi:RNA polymerase sigma-70 factor (ECF subfamily)